jgi:high-affinity iron transporter
MIMGLAFLRLPQAQTKWRLKLLSAYQDKHESHASAGDGIQGGSPGQASSTYKRKRTKKGQGGRMILFGLPFVTVLREGLEGVVFLGGIGLSEKPLAVAGGALMGLVIGSIIGMSFLPSRVCTNE